jgi:predicted amidophosphoribosyltransferase
MVGGVFPVWCVGCGRRGDAALCGRCIDAAQPATPSPPPEGVACWFSPFAYEGAVREAVARLKYRNQRSAVHPLARAMAGALDVAVGPLDLVTWVPTTPARRRDRGFDHGELLAREVARLLRLRARRLLKRLDATPQTELGAAARAGGPVLRPTGPAPPSVLVVDDVATTGASLRAAALTLGRVGCKSVIALTCARTPLKRSGPSPDV